MAIKELNDLGKTIFMQRYAYPGEKSYAERCKAIARHIASAESPDMVESTEKKFYDALSSGDFVPGGRIIFGAGRNKYNLLNCYVIEPQDNIESIGKTIQDMYKIFCAGSWLGNKISRW